MNEHSKELKIPFIEIFFMVWGDELDPEEISKILKIKPTETAKKGDLVIGKKTGTTVLSKTGKWFLKTKEHVNSCQVIDHVEFILTFLRGLEEPLCNFKTIEKLTITFLIQVDVDTDSVEFDLNPNLLKEIVRQKIELSFSIF